MSARAHHIYEVTDRVQIQAQYQQKERATGLQMWMFLQKSISEIVFTRTRNTCTAKLKKNNKKWNTYVLCFCFCEIKTGLYHQAGSNIVESKTFYY